MHSVEMMAPAGIGKEFPTKNVVTTMSPPALTEQNQFEINTVKKIFQITFSHSALVPFLT